MEQLRAVLPSASHDLLPAGVRLNIARDVIHFPLVDRPAVVCLPMLLDVLQSVVDLVRVLDDRLGLGVIS